LRFQVGCHGSRWQPADLAQGSERSSLADVSDITDRAKVEQCRSSPVRGGARAGVKSRIAGEK
jgi:hypothetical protein